MTRLIHAAAYFSVLVLAAIFAADIANRWPS